MAFTDERLTEICQRYQILDKTVNEDGEVTVHNGLDKTKMKVYHANMSDIADGDLLKSKLTDNDEIGYWGTVIDGKHEIVFDDDPALKDSNNKFLEITE